MQTVPARNLADASINNNIVFNLVQDGTMVFGTTVFTFCLTDVTFLQNPDAAASAGKFLQVPFLVGDTKSEVDVFTVAQEIVETGTVNPILDELISDLTTTVRF